MPSGSVRVATLADLVHLRRLWAAMVAEAPLPYPQITPEDYRDWTSWMAWQLEQPTFRAWLAVDGAEAIGMVAGRVDQRIFGQPRVYGEPLWLYVAPEARGTGTGAQLVAAIMDWYEALGIGFIEIQSAATDDQWARRGWMPLTVRYVETVGAIRQGVAHKLPAEPNGKDAHADVDHE